MLWKFLIGIVTAVALVWVGMFLQALVERKAVDDNAEALAKWLHPTAGVPDAG